MHIRQNLAVGLILSISMVGISYGVGGDMGAATEPLTDGSAVYPYLIEDLADFDVFADQANAATYWSSGVYTKLTCDPNLTGRPYTTAVIAPDTSTDSGFQGTVFAGIFDGNGHIVSNLTIDTAGTDNDYLGLFGRIESGGQITNLGMENINITGDDYLGGLCGCNSYGTISNCYSSGSVTGGTGSYYLGGLCGSNSNYGTITNCYAIGPVTGGVDSRYLGGLCGENRGTITNCYAIGPVTGGVDSRYLGGLCGKNHWGTIINCFWDTETSGQAQSDGGFGRTTSQMKQASTYNGWGNDIWAIDEGIDYPHLVWEGAAGTVIDNVPQRSYSGSGTETVPFVIGAAADLSCLTGRREDWDKYFEMANDIDMAAVTDYLPPGNFTGKFNGNGHCVINLTVNESTSRLGLFGYLGNNGEINNLGMVDVDIAGYNHLGGLCGENRGTITNCYSSGSVTGGEDSYNLGGLCGDNWLGTITNCCSSGSVTGGEDSCYLGGLCGDNGCVITNCYAAGLVTGGNNSENLGGLCGKNHWGVIRNCYSTGSVTGGEDSCYLGGLFGCNWGQIRNCYSSGSVTGGNNSDNLGGLCGWNDGGTANCFWDTQTSGMSVSDGGTGKTTAEMQTQSTFTDAGWDFSVVPVWHMPFEAVGYPMLGWQKDIPGDFTGRYGVYMDDFAVLSNAWLSDDSPTANWNEHCDLNGNGVIDPGDLKIFANHWLCD